MLLECPHCRYQNPSSEVYCRRCQRPVRNSTTSPGDTVVTSSSPRHPVEKRVKIWFDDEGEPHETLVDPEPEALEPARPAARSSSGGSLQRGPIWFDDEGEPHESPFDEARTRVEPRPKQAWFDNEGLPHDTPQAAAAANASRQGERTTVSPTPQTHSAFTQGLTPKPIFFERVETARDVPLPRPSSGQTVLRPTQQLTAARQLEQTARSSAAGTAQVRTPSTPGAPRQAPAAPAPPSARSTAGNLGTPVLHRIGTPNARAVHVPAQPGTPQAAAARPSARVQAPPAGRPPATSTYTAGDDVALGQRLDGEQPDEPTEKHALGPSPYREVPQEHTVATGTPQARGAPATVAGAAQQRTVATSTSLASNYRAAVAHAALADSAAPSRPPRTEIPDRRSAAQAPLIGIEQTIATSAHTGTSHNRAVSTYTPFDDLAYERTVATEPPMPAQLASTKAPTSSRSSVASPTPQLQRPTLTHAPVLMEDRGAHQSLTAGPAGGFFNRAAEPPAVAPSAASPFNRPEAASVAAPNPFGRAEAPLAPLANAFGRPEVPLASAPASGLVSRAAEPTVVVPSAAGAFFSRPTEPVVMPPQARRITDPIGLSPTPAPVLPSSLEGRLTTNRDAVHEQATVVRDSPFLQSEPTVVRSAPLPEEDSQAAPMRRRLTEPMLARGAGFIAPANQGILTERAPLWRLAIAAAIDGGAAVAVGLCTAAAEMLMFGGHWPTETTTPLDTIAMWMHNYPGTQKRAVVMMVVFAWGYAALGARTGRTLGRVLMRLIALQQNGAMITWPRAAWRSFAGLFSVLFFGAGYFWAVVDGQHRALHDVVSRSIVVARKSG